MTALRSVPGISFAVRGANQARYLLDTNPVRRQQSTDPSLTPPRFPRNTSPMIAAMTTMDVSEQMRMTPTSFLSLRVRA